jgi:hypothetical protein
MQVHRPATMINQHPMPSLGPGLRAPGYQGPLTTTAPVAAANHIRSFYKLFAILVLILVIFIFGIVCIIVGSAKSNACPVDTAVVGWLTGFGVVDMIACIVFAIFVRIYTFAHLIFSFLYRLLFVQHTVTIEIDFCVTSYILFLPSSA